MSGQTPKSGSNIPNSGAAPGKNGKPGVEPKSKPSPKPKRGLFGRLVIWLAVLVVIAGAGAAASFEYWRPWAEPHIAAALSKLNIQAPAPAAQQNEQISALAARVAALEQAQSAGADTNTDSGADSGAETAALTARIETLETALDDVRAMAAAAQLSGGGNNAENSAEPPAAVTETFARINDRLAELETAASAAAKPGDVTLLASRLEALENSPAAGREGGGALMVALGDLRAAMASGAPYHDTLAVIAAVPGAAPKDAVAALQVCAASGAPAPAQLREDFRIAAREAARVRHAAEDETWMNTIKAKAAALVSVRRIGETAPETLDGKLAAAERALETGAVAAAAAAAAELEGAPGRAVQPWLESARLRLGCEQGLAALGSAAAAWFGGS